MSSARAAVVSLGVWVVACRPVVAPSDPGSEPADREAAATPWTPAVDPTTTSAFAGETLAPAHAHHGHGNHGAKPDDNAKPPVDEPKPFTTEPAPEPSPSPTGQEPRR